MVALVGLLATAGFARVVSRVVLTARTARFDDVVERAIATLDGRLASHRATVSAAAAVLGAGASVDDAEFGRLAANLRTQEPPPVMLAWCEKKPGARPEDDATCPIKRAWSRAPVGHFGPSSDLAEHADLSAAMSRASTGRVSAMAVLRRPGSDPGADVAFVFPVLGPADFADRRADAVRGFVVSAFSADELLRAALRPSASAVDVSVHDAGSPSTGESLLLQTGDPRRESLFTSTHTLDVAGRSWRLDFSSTPGFDREDRTTLTRLVWMAGTFVTFLFTALTWSEFRARTRAERIGRRLVEADEGLRRASRAKDAFLAMLGHELRNPLGAIANALKVVRMRNSTDPVVSRALTIAERQVAHQSRLVDDLLDLTRLGAGKILLEPTHLDLRDVARRASTSVRPALDERRHSFTLELPSEPTEVVADPTRLEQILVNLLTNAIKYTPNAGAIELSVRRDPEARQAVISVRDNGVGIDEDALQSVFSPFFQESNEGAERRGGLGIGLTIVERLVQLHGGRVEARSEGRGRGSEFVVRLPLARKSVLAARPGTSRLQPIAANQRAGSPLDVLIVEDMSDNREMLAELVSMFGHRVRQAKTGAEALAAVDHRAPDLALVDLGLPDMDGLEVAREIRATHGGAGIRLVAVTGFGSPEDRARALEAGFDQHMVKPLSVQRLVDLLGQMPASNSDALAEQAE